MHFLLQQDNFSFIMLDSYIVKKTIEDHADKHSYEFVTYDDFFLRDSDGAEHLLDETQLPERFKTAIPVGSVQFVNAFLSIFFKIPSEKPIEIPPFLQKKEFLKREYQICSLSQIPTSKRLFIKNASANKAFSFVGTLRDLEETQKTDCSIVLSENLEYLCSEVLDDIVAEFRIYVVRGEIKNISCYKGDPCAEYDLPLLKKAINLCSSHDSFPKSYSLDIMITRRGTAILEIHNFLSLALYSTVWDESLLIALSDGLDHAKANPGL